MDFFELIFWIIATPIIIAVLGYFFLYSGLFPEEPIHKRGTEYEIKKFRQEFQEFKKEYAKK